MNRLELLEEAYRIVPANRIKVYLFDQMRRVAPRFNHLGVTRLYPILSLPSGSR